MNRAKSIVIAVSLAVIIFVGVYASTSSPVAQATYSYGLTCNPSDSEALLNTLMSFAAQTSNPDIGRITFTFTNPDGKSNSVFVTLGSGSNCAVSTCTLDKIGYWYVTAKFEKFSWGNWQTIYTCPKKTIHTCYSYTLTCSCPDDKNVPLDTTVTATAKTTDSCVDKIKFTWTDPTQHVVFTETKTVTKVYDNGQFSYSTATSTQTLDKMGDWCVKAEFLDIQGCGCYQTTEVVACRKCCLNVIPEMPVLGTVGASSAMLLGFAYKIKRKPKQK